MTNFVCPKCHFQNQTHCPPGTTVECKNCGSFLKLSDAAAAGAAKRQSTVNPQSVVRTSVDLEPLASKPSTKGLYAAIGGGFLILACLLGLAIYFLRDKDEETKDGPFAKHDEPAVFEAKGGSEETKGAQPRKKDVQFLFGGPGKKEADPKLTFEIPLPFEAIATRERLKEIKIVQIKGRVRFTKAINVNDVSITWESLRRLKYEERLTKGVSTVLLIANDGWFLSDGTLRPLEGDGLGFYRNFNYATILSNLIPLMEEGFQIANGKDETIRGEECFSVKINRVGHPEMRMFFQKGTKLLTKVDFTGKFLNLGTLTFSKQSTFVEFYFSDYEKSDGVNHWRKQEQWRDGQKFSELVISKLTFFNEPDDSLFFVKGLEAHVERALAKEKEFERSLDKLKGFLEEKNLKYARTSFAACRRINPIDHRLLAIEEKLGLLERELSEKFVAEIEACVEKEDFEGVLRITRKAFDVLPGDRKIQASQLLAQDARKVLSLLEEVGRNNKERQFANALDGLKKANDLLRKAQAEQKLGKFRDAQLQNVERIRSELARELFTLGRESGEKAARLSEMKDFAAVIKLASEALEFCRQAKEAWNLPGGPIKEPLSLDREMLKLGSLINNGVAQRSLSQGRKHLMEAHLELKQAADDDRKLFTARDRFRAAEKCLAAAEKGGLHATEELKEVRTEIRRIEKVVQPVFFDSMKGKDLSDFEAKGWSLASNESRTWLQSNDPDGILQTKPLIFPKNFVLTISLGLVNQRKQFSTNSWKYRPNLVHISLVPGKESKAVKFSLGKSLDPRFSFGDFVTLDVNKKSYDVTNQVAKKGQDSVELVITKTNDNLTFEVAGKAIDGISCNGTFQGIEIAVNNGLDSKQTPVLFPVVFSVSLSRLGQK